jgi:hypothetical protein
MKIANAPFEYIIKERKKERKIFLVNSKALRPGKKVSFNKIRLLRLFLEPRSGIN